MAAELETINSLVDKLQSKDGIERVKARKALVARGKEAVFPMIEALQSRSDWTRWEATKTLAEIGDSISIQALIYALEDHEFAVRWLAAEGLTHIGSASLEPLLEALIHRSDSSWLREGAHHVLHDLREPKFRRQLKSVISAIEDTDSSLQTGIAAKSALDIIRQGH